MRIAAPLLLAAIAAALFAAIAVAQEPPDGPAYEAGGEIVARTHANGTTEFCFDASDGQRICPRLRFINPASAPRGRWLRSSEVEWRTAIDADRVIVPPAPEPPPAETACNVDIERMTAAT